MKEKSMWNTVMYPCTDIGQACQWWEVKGMRGIVTGTCGAVILNTGLGNAVKENSYCCRTTCGTLIWLETRAWLKHVISPWKSHTGELMVAVISLMGIFKSFLWIHLLQWAYHLKTCTFPSIHHSCVVFWVMEDQTEVAASCPCSRVFLT